jgi:hypothetical protein
VVKGWLLAVEESDMEDLTFDATLDALAEWEGQPVAVGVWAVATPGAPTLVTRGVLGRLTMTSDEGGGVALLPLQNQPGERSVPGPSGVYLRAADFQFANLADGELRVATDLAGWVISLDRRVRTREPTLAPPTNG